jgi:hypothetical protein
MGTRSFWLILACASVAAASRQACLTRVNGTDHYVEQSDPLKCWQDAIDAWNGGAQDVRAEYGCLGHGILGQIDLLSLYCSMVTYEFPGDRPYTLAHGLAVYSDVRAHARDFQGLTLEECGKRCLDDSRCDVFRFDMRSHRYPLMEWLEAWWYGLTLPTSCELRSKPFCAVSTDSFNNGLLTGRKRNTTI